MRAADDIRHQEIVQKIRNLNNEYPIDDIIIDILFNECQLTKEVVENDPELKKAKICISANIEKVTYENLLLKQYAIDNGYPIIKWKKNITSKLPENCLDLLFDKYYENNSQIEFLYQSFVPGSSCICIDNLNVSRGMCNGTPVFQHSLVMENETEMKELNELILNSIPGQLILLEKRPKYVNMSILPTFNSYWNDNSVSIYDPINEVRYIPFAMSSLRQDSVNLKGIVGISKLYYNAFPFEHNYVCTEYKVQGQTLPRIISVLRTNPTTSFKALSLSAFLVRISRVKKLEHHKIFPVKSRKDLEFLKGLKYSNDLKLFLEAYNENGLWIDPFSDIQKSKKKDDLSDKLFCKEVKVKKGNLDNVIINNPKSNPIQPKTIKAKICKVKDEPIVTRFILPTSVYKSNNNKVIYKNPNKVTNVISDQSQMMKKAIKQTFSDCNYFNYGLENQSNVFCYFNAAIQMIIHDDNLKRYLKITIINTISDANTNDNNRRLKLQLDFVDALQTLINLLDNNNNHSAKHQCLFLIRNCYKKVYPDDTNLMIQNDYLEFYGRIFEIFNDLSLNSLCFDINFRIEVINNYSLPTCSSIALQCYQCDTFNVNQRDFAINNIVHNNIYISNCFPEDVKRLHNNHIPLVIAIKLIQDYNVIELTNVNQLCTNCKSNCSIAIKRPLRIMKYNNIITIHIQFFSNAEFGYNTILSNFIQFPLEFNYKDLELSDQALVIDNYRQDFINNKDSIYSLVRFVEHIGNSINSGHYKSYIRDKTYNVWYLLDDEIVSIITEDNILSILNKQFENGIYYAFYEKNISCIRNKITNITNLTTNDNDIRPIIIKELCDETTGKVTFIKEKIGRRRNKTFKAIENFVKKTFKSNNKENPFIVNDDNVDVNEINNQITTSLNNLNQNDSNRLVVIDVDIDVMSNHNK